jgi:hypothetical protein
MPTLQLFKEPPLGQPPPTEGGDPRPEPPPGFVWLILWIRLVLVALTFGAIFPGR